MVKNFVTDREWTLDEFRQTLGRVSRQQMATFLSKEGSDSHQLLSAAYQLSWELFNWRNPMALPLLGACVAGDVIAVHQWHDGLPREERTGEGGMTWKRTKPFS